MESLLIECKKNTIFPKATETLPDMRSLKTEVIDVIVKGLGLTKSAFYLRENMSQKTDYLEIKERIFGNKSAKTLYDEITGQKKNE